MGKVKMVLISIIIFVCIILPTTSYALDYTQVQIKYNISTRKVAPQYIAIHDTANMNSYANAWMHYEYFNSGDKRSSADIFIDRYKIYFINNIDKYYTWAVGDKYYNWHHPTCQNYNSISIEMCMNDRSPEGLKSIYNKTLETTKYLMDKYKIPESNVLRHYDITRKPCPANFPMWDNLPGVNKTWLQFKADLKNKPPGVKPTITPTVDIWASYTKGIEKFKEKGVIKSPEFWYNIDKKSRTELINSIKQLMINYSNN